MHPAAPAEMWRCSSVPSAPGVTAAPGVAAPASRVSLSKHRTRHQRGAEDTDYKTRTFTHDCILRGRSGLPPGANPIIPAPLG
jgi:hypothetical protein